MGTPHRALLAAGVSYVVLWGSGDAAGLRCTASVPSPAQPPSVVCSSTRALR